MGLSLLDNIAALQAENAIQTNSNNLQTTLFQLSTGSRLNSGADDPAGLSIANELQASIAALQQSSSNANSGIGLAQTADGSFAQVTTLLDRAVTLATEASNGGLSTSQATALNTEYQSIQAEINRIGTSTTFNGTSVFSASTTSIFLSDAGSNSTIAFTVGTLSTAAAPAGLGLAGTDLLTTTDAQAALTAINTAVGTVASDRGTLGASLNRLQSAQNVINVQVQNITSAESSITSANIPQDVSNLAQQTVLEQTGIAALSQANQQTEALLALFR
jgi:flagellin